MGVAEVAPRGSPAWTELLVRRWNPTPLEMFQALAPGAEVPELLVSDHRAATAAEPRSLTLPPLEGVVPIDLFDCDPGEDFEQDWEATYAGVTQVVVSEVYEPFPWQEFAWYPGYAAYLGINNNQTTHFGICSGDWDGSYSVQVERRISPGNWVDYLGAGLSYGARLTFHSNVPGIYRMRLLEGGPLSLLSAGAAYTPNPPLSD